MNALYNLLPRHRRALQPEITINDQEILVYLSPFLFYFNFPSRMMIEVVMEDLKQGCTLVRIHWPKIYMNK